MLKFSERELVLFACERVCDWVMRFIEKILEDLTSEDEIGTIDIGDDEKERLNGTSPRTSLLMDLRNFRRNICFG